ncbi:type I restriction enzyme, S subunit [Chryseobacterium wanjuense]|uniref:Type I restriction enzyme, S subunit n=2 Tax=Chryseobacterium wanjuense TaxID=356305 RepID=A0A1I0QGR7_9FLAO|nr:type I restriction enzyme, S subunit [Chryseobacterium wanjuense]
MKRISELGKIINGLTGKSGEDFGTGKPFVTYKQVFDNSVIDFQKCARVQIGENENQNSLQKGDILFTTSSETPSEVGFASVLIDSPKEETYLNSFCFSLRPFSLEETQPQFSRYLFHSSIFRKAIISLAQGSTRYNISKAGFLNIMVPVPKSKEQQKIASCLSSLDEVIVAHSRKLELLKDHKKGLMQSLFPQGGEKAPKFRFKEFEKDGEWIERKLEELAKRGSGHTPNKQVSNYYNGGIKWVSLADSNKLDSRYVYDTKIQISKEGIENSSAVLHPAGTVILSRDAGVGKSAILHSEMAVSQHFIVWVCDESKLSNWFLYYVFQILKPVFESIAVGSTIKTIGLPYFKELLIIIPSVNEQLKIASCLFSLDELITAQAEKIEQLKQHKKGLMQGLFPKMND